MQDAFRSWRRGCVALVTEGAHEEAGRLVPDDLLDRAVLPRLRTFLTE